MSDVERFYVSSCGNHSCDPLLIESDGEYVYYDDYAKLKAENEALLKEQDSWHKFAEETRKAFDEVAELRKELDRLEYERAEQWRLRRNAEADRDTKSAVIAELRDQLAAVNRSPENPS